ncbi:LCP family glycopolymer transferase [Sporosarcina luteola]|uniref:LCP family glycopolymer transferase n=1 Tax=Sporosarcina luteola TaxID=582850 RepID=UPI00203CB1DF|nr:LCP family protein [Sporosarcina luteola]MCM3708957.1 LCP family protein [Sporosarcina luteola]
MAEVQKKSHKKLLLWAGGIACLLVSSVICYALFVVNALTETAKEIHEPMERVFSEKREDPVVFHEKDPFSVLILGVDEREGDKGRSDTMIVLTVNPTLQSIKMVSIPRDTYSAIVGMGFEDKLNHAYAFGGIEMSLATVEHFLDIPIDYVVQVNMKSFKEIIDAVGGVSVTNTLEFAVDDHSFPKGELILYGEEALAYVRMRMDDPRGDFGRQDRQKQVIQGVLQKGAKLSSLLKFKGIFDAIGNNVKTNMTFDEMVDVQKNYRNAAKSVEQIRFEKGEGKRMDGIWYYMMDSGELEDVKEELKAHLGME